MLPGSLRNSGELRLLLAWLDAWHDDGFHEDQFKTAIAREEARRAGRLSPAVRYLGEDADPELLEIFALPAGEGVQRLLGYEDEYGFRPGLAGLSQQEARVMHRALEGYTAAEIQRQVSRRWRRGQGLSVRTVEDHLLNGKAKIRRLLMKEAS